MDQMSLLASTNTLGDSTLSTFSGLPIGRRMFSLVAEGAIMGCTAVFLTMSTTSCLQLGKTFLLEIVLINSQSFRKIEFILLRKFSFLSFNRRRLPRMVLTRYSNLHFSASSCESLIRISFISRWQESYDFSILTVSSRMEDVKSARPSAVTCSSPSIHAVSVCLILPAVKASIFTLSN
jgi:hypothetical protein